MADEQARIEPTLPQITRYLRMGTALPDEALAARIAPLTARVMAAAQPRRVWHRVTLPLSGVDSASLVRHLSGCTEAFLVCGTLGAGVDAVQRTVAVTSAADALIAHAVATAAIENWMDRIEDALRESLTPDQTLTTRFSPGYGDFPLTYQRTLLRVLDTARSIGVSLTDGGLLVPSKSVTAVIGIRPFRHIS